MWKLIVIMILAAYRYGQYRLEKEGLPEAELNDLQGNKSNQVDEIKKQ